MAEKREDLAVKLAQIVTLALHASTEDEARTSALLALRFAAKHGLVIHPEPTVVRGASWHAAMRDEERKRSSPASSSSTNSERRARPQAFDPRDPRWTVCHPASTSYVVMRATRGGWCRFCGQDYDVGAVIGIRPGERPVHATCAAENRPAQSRPSTSGAKNWRAA
jgi:hypothetical protein